MMLLPMGDALRRFAYAISDQERAEIALGLSCIRVARIDHTATLVNQELFLQDETRFEYFGRADLELESDIPKTFFELISFAQEGDPIVALSATVLNAVDDYVEANHAYQSSNT